MRLSAVLTTLGAVLLAYVLWNYGSMLAQQRALQREWRDQQARASQTSSTSSASLPANDSLTRLTIPSINLDAIVVTGTGHKELMEGPGWMSDTAQPGEVGNAVISAHRDTFFRHIVELKKGDVVQVSRGGKTYKYEVTGKKIVPPSDMSVVQPTNNRQLTLITCYPTYYIGPAPDRLVVFTKASDEPAQTAKAAGGGGTN